MNYFTKASLSLLASMVMLNAAASLKADKPKPITVPKILKATYSIEKSLPPNLVVNAIGEVNTGGYTNVNLDRVIYKTIPKDGIQDYVLTAVSPTGPVPQVISKVKASHTWKAYPAWVKGIRVRGVGEGIVLIKFEQSKPKPRPVYRRFTGTSKEGSFEKALAAAIAKLNQALSEGGIADASASWKVDSTSGQVGGIAGLNQISVSIVAERQPPWPWPRKKQPQKLRQQKKPTADK
ncbi:hypothetical protein [Gimesia fumaroli]|uniref:Uncharacterized protein n=1 Tax=Gimesia fumaroli TaxID=2527976 RepID=A0A518I4T4_9PLAN|nr:hypothetical protein [Gimesia fumaroli]QDV48131.1 hypothetical protein Enr17x_01400 [Gimesia fumaroli]